MFVCIWCESKNRGIGLNNQIPWKVKEDLKLFKTLTLNHKIVMGKKTYLSIGKPLPKRNNYVLSKTENFNGLYENLFSVNDTESFIEQNKQSSELIYIIGGKQIYDKFLDHSNILVVSKLHDSYECDVFMDNSFKDFELKRVFFFDDFDLCIYVKKGILCKK